MDDILPLMYALLCTDSRRTLVVLCRKKIVLVHLSDVTLHKGGSNVKALLPAALSHHPLPSRPLARCYQVPSGPPVSPPRPLPFPTNMTVYIELVPSGSFRSAKLRAESSPLTFPETEHSGMRSGCRFGDDQLTELSEARADCSLT